MARSKIVKEIFKISEGLLASITDLILTILILGYESILDPRIGRSLLYTQAKLDRRLAQINYRSIKRAIRYAMEKGWIKENLEITEEGQKRLKGIFQEYSPLPKWDGNWYLVNYDIPEKLRLKREILRENIKILGFGKLQNSVWISPYNFLGDVEKIVKELKLTSYVILAISNKVGREESKILAEKVWRVSEIEKEYREFIFECGQKKDVSPWEAFIRYQSILRRDPRLPRELLPEDWPAEEAYELYQKIMKNSKKKLNFE
jgi:phenylacetic acid degradation operon negative regulatory protein